MAHYVDSSPRFPIKAIHFGSYSGIGSHGIITTVNSTPARSRYQMAVGRVLPLVVGNRLGRVCLHLACLIRGGKAAWHLAGVKRELLQMFAMTQPD